MTTRLAAILLSALLLAPAAIAPARAQDAAELVVRLARMEAQMRQMAGQIEELQFQNRRLEEELQRFRKDVDLRFEDAGAARGRSAAPANPSGRPAAGAPVAPPVSITPPGAAPGRRGDAFDPAANPTAPGAPRPIGTTPPSAPLRTGQPTIDAIIEEDQSGGRQAAVGAPLDLSRPPATPNGAAGAPPIGVSPAGGAKAEFDAGIAMMQRNEYAAAEMAFRQFLQSHPRSNLAADATYWLGESYFQRGLNRDAAEQYLKVSTSYPQAGRAADSMLKLGMALNALGARDQACSTYREIDRKYPNASPTVKRGVEREVRRARCEA